MLTFTTHLQAQAASWLRELSDNIYNIYYKNPPEILKNKRIPTSSNRVYQGQWTPMNTQWEAHIGWTLGKESKKNARSRLSD
jgi:hypothetical protein